MQEWLLKKDFYFEESYTKRELLEVVASNKPAEVLYKVDEMAKAAGHDVLRLPPYHCELNPIECVWSEVKRYVASNNSTFKLKDVEVHKAFENVTAEKWKNYERHIIGEEKKFYDLEKIQDAVIDRFIISLADNDDETSLDEEEDDASAGKNGASDCDEPAPSPLHLQEVEVSGEGEGSNRCQKTKHCC